MRDRVLRAAGGAMEEDDRVPSSLGAALLSWMARRPVDVVAGVVAATAAGAIMVNALFLQSGPHPAPIFANKPLPAAVAIAVDAPTAALPRPRPDVIGDVAANAKGRLDVVADIQRELAKRGFYDGAADGFYGPKTDAAIRDFEQVAGLRPSAEPNDRLLQAIQRSPAKAKPPATAAKPSDPIAALMTANPRVMAVQRALSSYGYGQITPSGFYDPETREAIEQFERERRLPVTGQISDRLTRELTAMTGRPFE